MTVRAVEGWQDAAVDLTIGEAVAVRYVTGTWTINVAGRWFDADGYPGYYPHDAPPPCDRADLPNEQNGALIGRIGDGPPFLIGNVRALNADRAGALRMRMNDSDACLSDNGGSVEVVITHETSAATPTSTSPPATTTTRPLATATATASAVPPTPGPTRAASTCVCRIVQTRAPAVVIQAALANPDRYYGWRYLLDPNKPEGPTNPRRECLSLRNEQLDFHPVFNGPIWRVGCH
ncbi:MAG: hypothetical protein ABI780_11160 [Ardenticatenales bacterium]